MARKKNKSTFGSLLLEIAVFMLAFWIGPRKAFAALGGAAKAVVVLTLLCVIALVVAFFAGMHDPELNPK